MGSAAFDYDIAEWLLFFYIYSFLGWVFESAFVSLRKRRLVNRGFLRGPFLPLYGSGAVLVLFVSIPLREHPVLVYVSGCIAATALEYGTGVVMEHLFKVRYWDYSNQKFNFQGQICLSSTLAWGGLTLLLVYGIHRPIESVVTALPDPAASLISYAVTVVFAADAALSVKAALEVRDILIRLEDIREELEKMQRRADAILAFTQEERKERQEELRELQEGIRQRQEILRERVRQFRSGMSGYSRGLLKGNPTAVSRSFREVLEELKERVLSE